MVRETELNGFHLKQEGELFKREIRGLDRFLSS